MEAKKLTAEELNTLEFLLQRSKDSTAGKLLSHIRALEEERRWIPVGERLPEKYRIVAVLSAHDDGEFILTGRFISGGFDMEGVTYWMPLPAGKP